MTRTNVEDEYFEWMYNLVCEGRYSANHSYRKLLIYLHSIEFSWLIPKDANRADDGESMRRRFAFEFEDPEEQAYILDCLSRPCSVLEMILALAIRCENDIMDDSSVGDRTGQWFWKMIVNLGLGSMTDERFDRYYVRNVIARFLNRKYEPDGRGGLFTVSNCEHDLRDVEIWTQMLYFLDTIV